MAEIEEAIEGVDEAIEGAEGGIEELPEEIQEEIEAEVAEARTEVAEFSKVAETLKTFLKFVTTSIPKVVAFVGKNVAIGVILWGVNVSLNKLITKKSPKTEAFEVKQKRAAIKALSSVIKTETDLSKKALDWMKEHKDDMITLAGFEVPLESVIAKYLTPISEAVDSAYDIAKKLKGKLDGTIYYNIPTGGDMRDFLAAGDAFLKGFSDLDEFIAKNLGKIPQLATFPVKQGDIDDLTTQLKVAKDLPLR
ncbi:uncharacterized protein LOC103363406 [Stegastes partitus]|uniref:Uncharacterized protein LOC103363406 n=1 Tax=Stegastes partitus TaxID=144197 RepID=A0A9Y4KCM8_9TELE|nr:PREDICTED: uncharacterized protein LOC103363406 [Stegastes partitus]